MLCYVSTVFVNIHFSLLFFTSIRTRQLRKPTFDFVQKLTNYVILGWIAFPLENFLGFGGESTSFLSVEQCAAPPPARVMMRFSLNVAFTSALSSIALTLKPFDLLKVCQLSGVTRLLAAQRIPARGSTRSTVEVTLRRMDCYSSLDVRDDPQAPGRPSLQGQLLRHYRCCCHAIMPHSASTCYWNIRFDVSWITAGKRCLENPDL